MEGGINPTMASHNPLYFLSFISIIAIIPVKDDITRNVKIRNNRVENHGEAILPLINIKRGIRIKDVINEIIALFEYCLFSIY